MAERLTDAIIKGLTCPPGKKDTLVFDADLRGFCLRVQASGTKTFLLQYAVAGRKKRLVLGTWGAELTAAQARRRAEQERGKVRAGGNPVAERKAADSAARAALAAERFTVEKLIDAWTDKHLVERSESYRAVAPRSLKNAMPMWLAKPAASFAKADAIGLLDDTKKARGPIAANRLRAVARACWDWAVERGELELNVWAGTPKPATEASRERVLANAELGALWHAAEALGHPFAGILHLLILTGQRRSEVAELPLAELNMAAATWTLAKERAKNGVTHLVPLSLPALGILNSLPHLDGAKLAFENQFKTAPSGFGRVKARLDATMGEGIEAWTLHDIRRTVATGMQRLGVQLVVIEAVLNHVSGSRSGIVGVYQRHAYEAEKRDALDRWAEHVMAVIAKHRPQESLPAKPKAVTNRGKGRPKDSSPDLRDVSMLGIIAEGTGKSSAKIAAEIARGNRTAPNGHDALTRRVNRLKKSPTAIQRGELANEMKEPRQRMTEILQQAGHKIGEKS